MTLHRFCKRRLVFPCFVSAILAAAGCGHKDTLLAPLPLSRAEEAFDAAFKNSSEDIKREALDAVEALKSTNSPKALVVLQDLTAKPGLTPAQRELAARGMLTANNLAQTAAAAGDQDAAEVIRLRRLSK